MITITNGIDTFNVSKGAFPIYKSIGFRKVDDVADKAVNNSLNLDIIDDTDSLDIGSDSGISEEDAIFLESVVETPISQWSSSDIKRYANLNNIDISGAKNLKEGKAIIKRYFDSIAKGSI